MGQVETYLLSQFPPASERCGEKQPACRWRRTRLIYGAITVSVETRAVAPFVLSLVGGVLILLGAIVSSIFTFGSPVYDGSMSSYMSGMIGHMNCGIWI